MGLFPRFCLDWRWEKSSGMLEFSRLEKPWRWSPTIASSDPGPTATGFQSLQDWEFHPALGAAPQKSQRLHMEGVRAGKSQILCPTTSQKTPAPLGPQNPQIPSCPIPNNSGSVWDLTPPAPLGPQNPQIPFHPKKRGSQKTQDPRGMF